jgi:hypothetical protein
MSSSVRRHASAAKKAVILLGATAALLVGLGITAAPAQARPDPGEPVVTRACGPFDDPRTFAVERLGIHWVRCDYLVH